MSQVPVVDGRVHRAATDFRLADPEQQLSVSGA
jgi:hypothetical protein